MADHLPTSPPWPRNVKTIAVVSLILLTALALWRFFEFVELFILAALLAFLLNPIVNSLRRWMRLPHGVAILVAYVLFVLVIGVLALMVGASMQNQVGGLAANILETVRGLTALATRLLSSLTGASIQVGGVRLQLPSTQINDVMPQFYESLVGQVSGFIGQGGSLVTGVAQTALVTLTRTIVLIVLSIYLLLDGARFFVFLRHAAQQLGYGDDAATLITDLTNIWRTYFRGQVLLALIMSVLVSTTLFALRVDNPVALGIMAGVLELVPVLGQYITMAITVILVFFQPDPPGGLQPWLYTLIVAGVLLGIQQIQGNVILPRIHGRTLAVHPVLILLGVLIGASFAGVLGAILAPPMLATIKLFGAYIWHKMLDLPPFVDRDDDLGVQSSDEKAR
ncbi:MAG: AI-2E family transporter [Caldilinea sp.]